MLNFGNKEFRNLQEQVLENMKNIKSLQDLSLVGINVDYIVEDLSSIQSPEAGQMAAVGSAAPYTLYVYYNSSWVSFGEFPKEGPQGLQGPAGPQGPQGPRGLTGDIGPRGSQGERGVQGPRGATGARGEKGDKGDAGAPVTITVDNVKYTQVNGNITLPDYPHDGVWGSIEGNIESQADLQNALNAKEDVISATNKVPYEFVSNKPIIGNGTLTIQKNGVTLDTFTANATTDKSINISVPTNNTELTNGAGYITKDASDLTYYTKTADQPELTLSTLAYDTQNNLRGIELDGVQYNVLTNVEANPGSTTQNLTSIKIGGVNYSINGSTAINDIKVNGQSIVNNKIANLYTESAYNYSTNKIATMADIPAVTVTDVTVGGASVVSSGVAAIPELFSGNYNDLTNKPTIPAAQVNSDWNASSGIAQILNKPNLATVATSGSYNDLSDKPTIPTVDYPVTDVKVGGVSVLSNKVAVIPELFDGNYNSLENKPDLSVYALSSSLSTVATSGSYDDLSNKPTLATVATTGAYSDLTGKPTIPTKTSQLTNDSGFVTSAALNGYATETWVEQKGYLTSVAWGDITGKPTLATVATSGSYNDLIDKPTIPPTTNELTNDSGFITNAALTGYATETWVGEQGYQTASQVSTTVSTAISGQTKETWTFELEDGSTVTKSVVLG